MKYLMISLLLAGLFGCSDSSVSKWDNPDCKALQAKQTEAFDHWMVAQENAINGIGSFTEAIELGEQHNQLLQQVERACLE